MKIWHAHRNLIKKIGDKVFVLLGVFLALFPISPAFNPFAYFDSGVFLYIGWRILNGELPYRDIWDHKPPVIYYINALGLGIANNSRWGVWLIEFVSLFIAAYLGYHLVRKLFGRYPALVSSFIWLLSLTFLLADGNYTTEYTLPLQFGALYLFYTMHTGMARKRKLFAIGILGGLAFFTKQTAIALWLAIVLYMLVAGIKDKKLFQTLKEIGILSLGVAVVSLLIGGYFLLNQAWEPFWESAFVFNFRYMALRELSLLQRLRRLVNYLNVTNTGIFQFALLGVIVFIFLRHRKGFHSAALPLLTVALISLPLELFFIQLSGFIFSHYFLTLLPAMALFTGLLFWVIVHKVADHSRQTLVHLGLAAATIALLGLNSLNDYNMHRWEFQNQRYASIVAFIEENSTPDDTLLAASHEVMLNFHTQRKSPTRFVYQFPLRVEGYTTDEMILEFLDDIIVNQPKFLVGAWHEGEHLFVFPTENDQIKEKIALIDAMYVYRDEIDNRQIFQLVTDNAADG